MRNIILLLFLSLLIFGCTDVNDNKDLLSEINDLKTENDSLKKRLEDKQPQLNNWYDGSLPMESGIENVEAYIEKKLRERTELIPTNPVLGGSMQFRDIQLLSNEWLIADFEDGHIQGKAIYKYQLTDSTQVEFELLDTSIY